MRSGEFVLAESDRPVRALGDALVSANAYIGAEPIVLALAAGADVVITGRAADPSLFVAPLVREFGWAVDDWPMLGRGTLVGHLLECAGQITGGYFADPGVNDVPSLDRRASPPKWPPTVRRITKVAAGWRDHAATCKEQLLYEAHDPARTSRQTSSSTSAACHSSPMGRIGSVSTAPLAAHDRPPGCSGYRMLSARARFLRGRWRCRGASPRVDVTARLDAIGSRRPSQCDLLAATRHGLRRSARPSRTRSACA
jgi:hypothetical protein